ncbi:amidohydrolase family protein [Quadrisphaera setariae]|uniref:Amidohydrolase family protein n=1 Tax=Quadrisphaera setariae TaxID=2593304 RepID=A0A5C8Z6V4_9ACTN|nr:amidohydrolase family protein [Quadrisphaera setariae]TXR52958.1 amidohydrolase family protein [Quadrisphaera setariae]
MIIDAHQHFWSPEEVSYPWLTDEIAPVNRRFGPEHLAPLMTAAGVQATVLVQSADHRADTDAMLAIAERSAAVAGVVAWVPLDDADAAAEQLAELRRDPVVVGVRNLVHDRPDPDHVLLPAFLDGLRVLAAAGVPFDMVTSQLRHLEHVPSLSERVPGLRVVLDHLGKPPFRQGEDAWRAWEQLLARAAEDPLVIAKVSGLYPAPAGDPGWDVDEVRPAFEHAMSCFGPERLMVGGDWPISVLFGGYEKTWEVTQGLMRETSADERAALLGGTAVSTYRLDAQRLAAASASAVASEGSPS